MHGSAQPDNQLPLASNKTDDAITETIQSSCDNGQVAIPDHVVANDVLDETELDSALQLLVERAQYITGATGAALAVPQGDEMVCRASAGSSAPAVGARLQVRSGLTGESIARRQLLRCDNAESDPRVNLDACRALGIASIVVLPLLRRTGEVRGLFELFSDHAYAFEERDLIALERMAALTITALDLAEQSPITASEIMPRREPGGLNETLPELPAATVAPGAAPKAEQRNPPYPELSAELIAESSAISSPFVISDPIPVPEAMIRGQKCASCGFPVSEGRTHCLDCEKKDSAKKKDVIKDRDEDQDATPGTEVGAQEEFVPAFLANAVPSKESWMSNHVNVLAIVVLILAILVAVVVFR
jgi:hypothetical protein